MNKLIRIGVRDGLPIRLKGKIILTNQMTIILFIVGIVFTIVSFAFLPIVQIAVISISILCSTVFLFNHLEYYNVARVLVSLLPPLALSFIHATIVQANEPLIPYLSAGYICIAIIPFLIFDLKEKKILAPVILVYWIIYLSQGRINQWIEVPLDSSIYYESSISFISHLFNICLVSFGLILFQLKNHKAEQENDDLVASLQEQKEKLAKQNALIAKQHEAIAQTNAELEEMVNQRTAALKKSEHQLSIIYNNTQDPMGLVKVDQNGEYIIDSVNQSFLTSNARFGVKIDFRQIIGMNIVDFWKQYLRFNEQQIQSRFAVLERVKTLKQIESSQQYTDIKGIGNVFIQSTLSPVLNNQGDCEYILFVLRENTEKILADKALKASEAHSKTLFEHSPIIIWEEDFSEIKQYFNSLTPTEINNLPIFFEQNPAELERLATLIKVKNVNQKSVDFYQMGSKENHITEIPFYFVEASWEVLKAEFIALARGATTFESEIPIKTLNGEIVYLILNVSIPPEYQNTWESVIVSFIDITERKQAELELQQSRKEIQRQLNRNQLILASTLDGYILADKQARIVDVNPAYCQLTGYSREELLQMRVPDLEAHLSPEEIAEKIGRVIAKGSGRFETKHVCKDGTVVDIDANLSVMYFNDDLMITAFVRDITAEKKARQDLEYRFKFEQLLTKISSEFINLPLAEIDQNINKLLEQICKFTGFDRSFVVLISDETNTSSTHYEWVREGIESIKPHFQDVPLDTYPLLIEKLRKKESIIAKNLEALPENLINFKSDLRKFGIKSLIHVPMMWHGELIGFIGFDAYEEKESFPEDLKILLRFAGEMLSNILQRKKGEEALIISEQRLSTIYNSSQDLIGLFRAEPDGNFKVESANQPSIDLLTRLGVISNAGDLLEIDARTMFQNIFGLSKELTEKRVKMLGQVVTHKKTIKYKNPLAPLGLKSQTLFETVLSPVYGPEGNCTHVLFSSKDITKSELAKNRLLSNQKRLSSIYNGAKDQMAILDIHPNGDLILEEVNQSFKGSWVKAGFKTDLKYFLGKSMEVYLPEIMSFTESQTKERIASLQKVIKSKKALHYEDKYTALNGKKYILDVSVSPILNKDDICTKLLLVIRDITLKHQAKEKMIKKILETEDRERNRFAKELHDGLGQHLTAAALNFNLVKKGMEGLPPDMRQKFTSGNAFLKQAINESRNIAHNLMPQSISDFGYTLTIESLLENLNQSTGTEFMFYHNLETQRLPADLELSLYRITQEAINNILKHAEATEATIQLIKHPKSVILTIEDNGKGFDAAENQTPNFGLSSMKSRVRAYSGLIDIDSSYGKGTSITLEIPVDFNLQATKLQLSE